MTINVYTDGSCVHNGQPNALAGYGVYFEEDDIRNESKKIIGKQSNNTGELTGVIRAIEILEENLKNNEKIAIYTDSEYVIKCLTTYGDKLKKNDWKTSTDKKPPNVELVKKAYGLYNTYKKLIKLNHVDAHTNNTDEHSLGNKGADLLANLAIGHISCPSNETERDEKVYIDIPYSHKDIAREAGAKWDLKKKSWYYNMSLDADKRKQLDTLSKNTQNDKKHKDIASYFPKIKDTLSDIDEDPTESLYEEIRKHREGSVETDMPPIGIKKFDSIDSKDMIYIKIPFASKDLAKKHGARWSPSVKSWYYIKGLKQSNIDKLLELSK
jgi:ribonuclease HI